MDGYAVRASECPLAAQDNPIELPVAGQVFAERGESTLAPEPHWPSRLARQFRACRCCDSARTHRATWRLNTHFRASGAGRFCFSCRRRLRRGDELVAAGEVLNPGQLALLAFAGRPTVRVFQRPRAAIVCTGNELVDVAATPARGQVRNSNAVALSALVLATGGEPRNEGVAPDNRGAWLRCSSGRDAARTW